MAKKNEAVTVPEEGELLVDPKAKPNFWKPTVNGETKTGKLISVSPSGFGKALSVETAEGIVQIPVSVVLQKVPWESHVGKNLFFQYTGTVKRYKTYMVKVLKG